MYSCIKFLLEFEDYYTEGALLFLHMKISYDPDIVRTAVKLLLKELLRENLQLYGAMLRQSLCQRIDLRHS